MTGRRTAVIGGGISGLTAGYVLSRTDEVTLFEADRRLGWRGLAMTSDGLRLLQDLCRSLLVPPHQLQPRTAATHDKNRRGNVSAVA